MNETKIFEHEWRYLNRGVDLGQTSDLARPEVALSRNELYDDLPYVPSAGKTRTFVFKTEMPRVEFAPLASERVAPPDLVIYSPPDTPADCDRIRADIREAAEKQGLSAETLVERMVRPPMIRDIDILCNPTSILPGAITYIEEGKGLPEEAVPLTYKSRWLPAGELDKLRARIHERIRGDKILAAIREIARKS